MPSILISLAFFTIRCSYGAACCGGVSAVPNLISGDDRAGITLSTTRSEVIGDAPSEGRPVFRGDRSDEVTATYRLDGALLLSDRFQANLSVPLIQKSVTRAENSNRSTSLGDLSLGAAYEAWPEWTYSAWRPRGFLFGQATLPVARSIYDTTTFGATDAVGSGFYRLSGGVVILKAWQVWDTTFVPEVHASFPRTFRDSSGEPFKVSPGLGASAEIGIGYNFSETPIRVGFRIQPVWAAPHRTEDTTLATRSSSQWVWNTGLNLSYLANPEWSMTGSYTDQTIVGPAMNTTLSRTFAFTLQRRWPR